MMTALHNSSMVVNGLLEQRRNVTTHYYYYYYNCFTALWILFGTIRVKGKTRKVNVPIWIYWSKR